MNILITGASGFIGSHLCTALSKYENYTIRKLSGAELSSQQTGDYNSGDLQESFRGVDVVIHLAARVHNRERSNSSYLGEFRQSNTILTANLVKESVRTGVKRFIFLSTVKVFGDNTNNRQAYGIEDIPFPVDPFAISKVEAEFGVRELVKKTNLDFVIIRSPLVYGAGVQANFADLIRLVMKGFPLPFGAVCNRRSLVGIDNLIDLIITCVSHPQASNKTFLVSDDHDVSTTELLSELTKAAGLRSKLIPVPKKVIRLVAKLVGKQEAVERLCGSLQIDISNTKEVLEWKPPVSFEQGISRCFEKNA